MSPLSSSSSPNFFAQQNGVAGNSPQNRGQFRRQGSSYGPGHVHNMAVAVAPTRIDYSLHTKGGLRSWIVLIVFVLLCSALLTIFSDDTDPKEENVQPLVNLLEPDRDLEADETLGEPESVPTIEEEEEMIEPAPNTEEILLSKLREKALRNEVRRKNEKLKRTSKPTTKAEVVEEQEKEDDEEDSAEEDEDDQEEEEEEAEEETPEKRSVPTQKPEQKQKKAEKVRAEATAAPSPQTDDDEEEEEDEDDEEEEEAHKYIPHIHLRRKEAHNRKRSKPWEESIQARKLAEDRRIPRKSLLKQKKQQQQQLHTPITHQHQKPLVKDDLSEEQQGDTVYENSVEELHALSSIKKKSGSYTRKSITNREDFKFRDDFDSADFLLEKHQFSKAMAIYDRILSRYKESPRAHFGQGRVFQLKSEFASTPNMQKKYLDEAIHEYSAVIEYEDTPDQLFRLAAECLIVCAKFAGDLYKVHKVQRSLIDRFPEDISLQNDFGITFLMMGRLTDARNVFGNVLYVDPANNIAQAYYGYILKVYDNELEKGVQWMRKGLKAKESILDAKFYFHLGDALTRLGRNQEAYKVYEEAVHLGLFPSVYQRSVHNLEGILARPWWALDQAGCGKHLRHVERQWTVIREEAMDAWNQYESNFAIEQTRLSTGGEKVLHLRKEYQFQKSACRIFPNTCEILQTLINESSCVKDEIKISVMTAGSRVWPHCGTTNYELEAQLGLQISSEARIRVGQETKGWKAGKFIVFDKSFETEMWFDGAASHLMRIVLSLNLWHPQVPKNFRADSE